MTIPRTAYKTQEGEAPDRGPTGIGVRLRRVVRRREPRITLPEAGSDRALSDEALADEALADEASADPGPTAPEAQPSFPPPRSQSKSRSPRSRSPGSRARRRVAASLVFGLPCSLYLVVGWILAFEYASFNGDAQARLANAYYVLFSRDPHLAAIGFVWNPLPSLSVMPLLPLKMFWPSLTTRAFAGNIMSAVFMAGAVYQVYAFLRDLGLGRPARIALVAVFALNPMIVYYGANGMSEGIFIFTLLVATRYLARWLHDDRAIWLVVSASALGLAYLARNEAAFGAFFAAVIVAVVSFMRSRSKTGERIYKALTDAFIFSLPFAVCFCGWALVSWVIVGHPFEQFQSVYGTASQLRVINQANPVHLTSGQAASRALHAVNSMAPGLPIYIVCGLLIAVRRKDTRVLALALPGGVLLFAVLAFTAGQTAGWYRYYIMAVPLVIMLAGVILAGWPGGESRLDAAGSDRGRPKLHRAARAGVTFVALVAVAVTLPSTASTLRHSRVASEEQLHLNYIFHPGTNNPSETAERERYNSTVKVAVALDEMHLPHGALLLDNFTPCVPYIVLNSRHPQQFVIPNDEDFRPALADPVTFHVRYLMAPPRGGYGSLDAVNREYPTLYSDGASISSPVRTFDFPGCPALTLFRIHTAGPS